MCNQKLFQGSCIRLSYCPNVPETLPVQNFYFYLMCRLDKILTEW